MQNFIIEANHYLTKATSAYYHTDYINFYAENHPKYINVLKNIENRETDKALAAAVQEMKSALLEDLLTLHQEILKSDSQNSYFVCMVPRSKVESRFTPNQLLFRHTLNVVLREITFYGNGINFIERTQDTRTTHLKQENKYFVNDGIPFEKGITMKTCRISDNVRGKNIILIDDVYTKTVNIDEDAIEALYQKGAKNVIFYAVGKTQKKI